MEELDYNQLANFAGYDGHQPRPVWQGIEDPFEDYPPILVPPILSKGLYIGTAYDGYKPYNRLHRKYDSPGI